MAVALVLRSIFGDLSRGELRVVGLVVFVPYQVVAVAVWGRTVGKAASRTKVVREEDRGPVGWVGALTRWAVPAVPTLAVSFVSDVAGLVALLWAIVVYSGILRDGQHRGLHDQAAGTIVVHEPRPA
jgi:uncharacterized RDD family membrane protein YckC